MAKIVIDTLIKKFGDAVKDGSALGDEVAIVDAAKLVEVATFLKEDAAMAFDSGMFVTATDRAYQDQSVPRFEVLFQLRSLQKRHRIRLKVLVEGENPTVPSLMGLWPSFNWQERETYDMYGINFEGHPDLRRIYMYEEFVGYPLRKDYPKDKRQPLVRRDDLVN